MIRWRLFVEVEIDALVALQQQWGQRAAVGEIVLRLAVPGFAPVLGDLHQAAVPHQRCVGGAGEQSLVGVGDVLLRGVDRAEQVDLAGGFFQAVAVDAVTVEHRLHGLGEAEAARILRAGRRLQLQNSLPGGRRRVGSGGWTCGARGSRHSPLARRAASRRTTRMVITARPS